MEPSFFFLDPGRIYSRIELQVGDSHGFRQIIKGLNKYYDFNLTAYYQLVIKKIDVNIFHNIIKMKFPTLLFNMELPSRR